MYMPQPGIEPTIWVYDMPWLEIKQATVWYTERQPTETYWLEPSLIYLGEDPGIFI